MITLLQNLKTLSAVFIKRHKVQNLVTRLVFFEIQRVFKQMRKRMYNIMRHNNENPTKISSRCKMFYSHASALNCSLNLKQQ